MSRQIRAWTALAAAVALVAAAVLSSPASAEPAIDPALAHAQAQLQWCQNLRQHDARTSADRAWADTCIRLWQREVTRLTPPSPSPSVPPTTTTAPPTTTQPTTTSTPPPTTSAPAAGYPTPQTTGVPPFWQPVVSRGSWTITAPGVYEDVRVTGSITVAVAGVTLRRVEVIDGRINNETSQCNNGLVVEDSTIRSSGSAPFDAANGAITPGGYTARRVEVRNLTEGFRAGGRSVGCGPVHIEDSFVLVRGGDCHCDGVQLYDGHGLYVDGLTVDWAVTIAGTTAFFAPSGEASFGGPVQVRHLLLKGGGEALTDNVAGFVEDYFYVRGSAVYRAMNVNCAIVSPFSARIGTIDSNYQVTSAEPLACGAGNGQ